MKLLVSQAQGNNTRYQGLPRADRASAVRDARRWVGSMLGLYRERHYAEARRRIRHLLRTDAEAAIKQFNDDWSPMVAWVEVRRGRLATTKTGAKLEEG